MLSSVVIVQNVCNNSSGRKSERFVSEAPADIPREDSDNLTSWWEDDESEELDDEPNDPDAEPDTAEDEADAEDWRLLWFSCCMAAGFSSWMTWRLTWAGSRFAGLQL